MTHVSGLIKKKISQNQKNQKNNKSFWYWVLKLFILSWKSSLFLKKSSQFLYKIESNEIIYRLVKDFSIYSPCGVFFDICLISLLLALVGALIIGSYWLNSALTITTFSNCRAKGSNKYESLAEKRKQKQGKRTRRRDDDDLKQFPCKKFKEGKCQDDPCKYFHNDTEFTVSNTKEHKTVELD